VSHCVVECAPAVHVRLPVLAEHWKDLREVWVARPNPGVLGERPRALRFSRPPCIVYFTQASPKVPDSGCLICESCAESDRAEKSAMISVLGI